MYRRVVISSPAPTSGNIVISYYVRGAIVLSQYRRSYSKYIASLSNNPMSFPVVFDDSVKLSTSFSVNDRLTYEFVLDVDENQPIKESVVVVDREDINVVIYNADGVIVCYNNATISEGSDPSKTGIPGEMTSVPGEAPGEMTSVPGEEHGEMAGETTAEPGETI